MAALQHSLTCSRKTPPCHQQAVLPGFGWQGKGHTDLSVPALLGSAPKCILGTDCTVKHSSAFLQGRELFTQDRYQESDGSVRIFFISLSQQIQAEPFVGCNEPGSV